MSLNEAIAATPRGQRVLAAARLTTEIVASVTAAERATGRARPTYRAMSRRQRRLLRNLDSTAAALGAYLHDLGFELEVTLVDAKQAREASGAAGERAEAVRAALAELEAAGLKDLSSGSAAVAVRCEVIKRFGPRAAQSLLFLQRIRYGYGERLAANLGQTAVDELTDSLIQAIAAVVVPAEAAAASDSEG